MAKPTMVLENLSTRMKNQTINLMQEFDKIQQKYEQQLEHTLPNANPARIIAKQNSLKRKRDKLEKQNEEIQNKKLATFVFFSFCKEFAFSFSFRRVITNFLWNCSFFLNKMNYFFYPVVCLSKAISRGL